MTGPLRRLLLVAALCATGCGGPAPSATPPVTGAHAGDVAPALSGTSLEGHQVSLASLRGSVVVLVFWASWCTPCQAEQPAVNTLADAEAGAGVRFLGVSVDLDRSAAQSYLRRFAVPYDSLIDSAQTVVLDYDVAGPPTTFIIDARGRVAAEVVGQVDTTDLRTRIDAIRGR